MKHGRSNLDSTGRMPEPGHSTSWSTTCAHDACSGCICVRCCWTGTAHPCELLQAALPSTPPSASPCFPLQAMPPSLLWALLPLLPLALALLLLLLLLLLPLLRFIPRGVAPAPNPTRLSHSSAQCTFRRCRGTLHTSKDCCPGSRHDGSCPGPCASVPAGGVGAATAGAGEAAPAVAGAAGLSLSMARGGADVAAVGVAGPAARAGGPWAGAGGGMRTAGAGARTAGPGASGAVAGGSGPGLGITRMKKWALQQCRPSSGLRRMTPRRLQGRTGGAQGARGASRRSAHPGQHYAPLDARFKHTAR